MADAISLIELPDLVLEEIFSYLLYDNIAQNRIVCRKFNTLGGKLLNKGYHMVERLHSKTHKAIKSKLPRRESERRVHPLARKCDIMASIETRLSMLNMTFTKWMDANLCCFIPGKVIDEILRLIRLVINSSSPPRAHELLQELRDISSMAMEHFDEKILPILKSKVGNFGITPFLPIMARANNDLSLVPVKNRLYMNLPTPAASISITEFNKLLMRETLNRRKIKAQSAIIAKQASDIAELRRHVEEWEAKLRDLTTNLLISTNLPSTSTALVPATTAAIKRKLGTERMIVEKKHKDH